MILFSNQIDTIFWKLSMGKFTSNFKDFEKLANTQKFNEFISIYENRIQLFEKKDPVEAKNETSSLEKKN